MINDEFHSTLLSIKIITKKIQANGNWELPLETIQTTKKNKKKTFFWCIINFHQTLFTS